MLELPNFGHMSTNDKIDKMIKLSNESNDKILLATSWTEIMMS